MIGERGDGFAEFLLGEQGDLVASAVGGNSFEVVALVAQLVRVLDLPSVGGVDAVPLGRVVCPAAHEVHPPVVSGRAFGGNAGEGDEAICAAEAAEA